MKVAIAGASGMLGQALRKSFGDLDLLPYSRNELDISDLDKTLKTLRDAHPGLLINAAAYTDVDGCESDPERAYLVNGLGARNLAIAADELRCPLVHISSDYVFDGSKETAYDEWDRPSPVSSYGRSKWMAEQFVTSLTTRFYIVRTSWLYGSGGKNFVGTIMKLLAEKESLQVVSDQHGSPTYTGDLAATIRQLVRKGYGTYHITNSGVCSWHEFALEIARTAGIDKPIRPVSSEEFPRPAKRPKQSALNNTLLRLEGLQPLRHWREALADFMLAESR